MSWGSQIKSFEREVIDKHAALVRDRATRIHQGVVFRSPVDTGSFRGSWTLAWGSPDTAIQPVALPGAGAISAPDSNLPPSVTDFPVAYVNNNKVYGPRLENGWSDQAPAGMVTLTVAEVGALP